MRVRGVVQAPFHLSLLSRAYMLVMWGKGCGTIKMLIPNVPLVTDHVSRLFMLNASRLFPFAVENVKPREAYDWCGYLLSVGYFIYSLLTRQCKLILKVLLSIGANSYVVVYQDSCWISILLVPCAHARALSRSLNYHLGRACSVISNIRGFFPRTVA